MLITENWLVDQFVDFGYVAVILSIFINTVLATLAVIPSVFVTSANITVFGFWEGTIYSFLGESIGAVVAFFLYRSGLRNVSRRYLGRFPNAKRLIDAQGKEAFLLIIVLRLIPFTPSSLVTYFASVGKVSWQNFAVASLLGKIPALLLEAYSVYHVANRTAEGKWLLFAIGCLGIGWIIKRQIK